MSEKEINYEIDNCITDLDTLKILDKRAMEDLENNTHEIGQQEVLTIIREFIRLKNDYNKEKEKNEILEDTLNNSIDIRKYWISKDKIKEVLDITATVLGDKYELDYQDIQDVIAETITKIRQELLEERN